MLGKRASILSICPVLICLIFSNSFADFDPELWPCKVDFYLNTTPAYANITRDVYNFPVLIRLNGFQGIDPNGMNMTFSDKDGVELPNQIERWVNGPNGQDTAEIWVLVPVVKANNSTQYITMHYGYNGGGFQRLTSDIFQNDYLGVWHIGQPLCSGEIQDYSSNGNTAYNMASEDRVVPGVIGLGRRLINANNDGTDEGIRVEGLLGSPDGGTFSCWVKMESADPETQASAIMSIGDNVQIKMEKNNNGILKGRYCVEEGGQFHEATSINNSEVLKPGWKYLTFVVNPGEYTARIYLNGNLKASNNSGGYPISWAGAGLNTWFGRANSESFGLSGVIDEIRVESVGRSPDWIKLCYENQKPDQTLVQAGAQSSVTLVSDGHGTTQLYDDSYIGGGNYGKLLIAEPWQGYEFAGWEVISVSPSNSVYGISNAEAYGDESSPSYVSSLSIRSPNLNMTIRANFRHITGNEQYPSVCGSGDGMVVDGGARLISNLSVNGGASIGSQFTVTGPTSLSGLTTIGNASLANSNLKISSDWTSTMNHVFIGTTPGSYPPPELLTVNGSIKSSGLNITGASSFHDFTALGTANLGDLSASGSATIGSGISALGESSFGFNNSESNFVVGPDYASFRKNLTLGDPGYYTPALGELLTVHGGLACKGTYGNATIDGDANVGGSLDVGGNVDATGDVNADGIVTANSEVYVNGGAYFGSFISSTLGSLWINSPVTIDNTTGYETDDVKLSVVGGISCSNLHINNWILKQAPDYVFATDYKLPRLDSVANFIKANRHLPDLPSAQEMNKNGVELTELNLKLLKKIEELTLYAIEMKNRLDAQDAEIAILKRK